MAPRHVNFHYNEIYLIKVTCIDKDQVVSKVSIKCYFDHANKFFGFKVDAAALRLLQRHLQ
jgi:hypothetical protein